MKVTALGNLSGATGDREKGEEFTVDAKLGEELVLRKLVVPVAETAAPAEKPAKAKE
ncbi:hypothetical protein [Pseudomonas vancouverensis]|uniref:hypothetical protein n=1 Tax=Pseudomonas vancouverensis TaxID=95300 RepID=UPI00087A5F49|nr:hypothetical protein [Pseudomonas vancouverensis]SDU97483.1 hypothetical protein SAMN05216558_1365 [Pseudomonas vancouverensis]